MTVTRLGRDIVTMNSGLGSTTQVPGGGGAGQVVTSNGSNGVYWGENIARISANGSNALVGPFVSFVSGSGITLSVSSNAMTITGTGSAGSFLEVTGGGKGTVVNLGNLGTTETINVAAGNYFYGTLDDNATIGFTGWTANKDSQITVELTEDGGGGNTPTFSGVTWLGGTTPAHDTTAGTTTIYAFFSRDGGTTIIGGQLGGGGGSALTILDEGFPLTTAATSIDFTGAGVTASGAGAAKTVAVPGVTSAAIAATGATGPILISDTPAGSPLVFADLLQNEAGTDLLYADLL